jgi:predicted phage tail protein
MSCKRTSAAASGAILGLAAVFAGVFLLTDGADGSDLAVLTAIFVAVSAGVLVSATSGAGSCCCVAGLSKLLSRKPKADPNAEPPNPYRDLT